MANKEKKQNDTSTTESEEAVTKGICGIIMPISDNEGYPKGHWKDVLTILENAAIGAGFEAKLVSAEGATGVIQKRIVQNIYSNPIVICDISSRNANVMLELGMRLAFDKPTIIVKDNKTPYSFDISPIEHLEYPSDLRYQDILLFTEHLKNKIIDTVEKAKNDSSYTTYLKHFGTFEVARIESKEVSETQYLISEINDIKKILNDISYPSNSRLDLFKEREFKKFHSGNYKIMIKVGEEYIDNINIELLYMNLNLDGIFGIISKTENSIVLTSEYRLTPEMRQKNTITLERKIKEQLINII
ncbi:hypothetical protein KKJ25_12390 [Xenorhabdus bovienii]|uniref:hypothetical protein n=1 Tax=Xenorhabdus bovienii TaxID=40576 RepID=UPI00237D0123|nr:hypothetical protein [Xenorhabdus bovienii]MDE1495723.1 hypothetical protein [Xenorhabdus bovienii]MDE9474033.1 hypothetical protein [Xenorhabdus bovienii]